jgi:tRNA-splicing ligase RtcB (3'-phosphate/5'-hydroxy nucleic acid ligase)
LLTLANSGIAEHHISVMPDVHLGKGATVGTVFASSNYVSPNAVGVDIGCGMCAVPVEGLYAKDIGVPSSKVITAAQKDQIF